MKAKLKKNWLMLGAGMLAGAFALTGIVTLNHKPTTALAGAETVGRALYYVDAGNLESTKDGESGKQYPGRENNYEGKPWAKKTGFMETFGLDFGTTANDKTKLYNSVLDKQFGEDSVTQKSWGSEGVDYKWHAYTSNSTDTVYDGYKTTRGVGEGRDEDANINIVYKFEVDDATTPLKVVIGTRNFSNWADDNSYPYKVNSLEKKTITSYKNKNSEYDSSELWPEETITGVEDGGKYYVTLQFSEDGFKTTSYVSWILVSTADYELPVTYSLDSSFVVKGNCATLPATGTDGSSAEATLDEDNQAIINNAENLETVTISATIEGKVYDNLEVTVLPANVKYFQNIGGGAVGDTILADGDYNAESGHGLVSNGGTPGWEGDPFHTSNRYDGEPKYQFDNLDDGKVYGVIVGSYAHQGWGNVRTNGIKINDVKVGEFSINQGNYGWETYYGTSNDGTMTVQYVKPDGKNDAPVATFILIYEHEHVIGEQIAGTEATCEGDGVKAHYDCEECGMHFADQAGNEVLDDLTIPAKGHTAGDQVQATEATCTEAGYPAYYPCTGCDKKFEDDQCETEIDEEDITPALGHRDVTHHDATADCTTAGEIEYWECHDCNKKFSDEDLTEEVESTTAEEPLGHDMTHHEATDASCDQSGTIEYWYCERCEKFFEDQDGENEIEDGDVEDPEKPVEGHKLTIHHEAQEATCTENGTYEYYECSVCGKKFSNGMGAGMPLNDEDIIEEAPGHGYEYDEGIGIWTWNGFTSATLTGVCWRNEEHHSAPVTATITSEVTTAATATTPGVRTYTATVEIDGVTYTDTKTEVIPATGSTTTPPTDGGSGTTDNKQEEKKGCGSAITASLAVAGGMLAVAVAAIVVTKKKSKE